MISKKKLSTFEFLKTTKDKPTTEAITKLLIKQRSLKHVEDVWLDPSYNVVRDADHWYVGTVATVKIGNMVFTIEATGEQRYYLYIKNYKAFEQMYKDKISNFEEHQFKTLFDKHEPIEEYVNKGGSNESFYDRFKVYFDTDKSFNKMIDIDDGIFELVCENNNWLETLCFDTITEEGVCLTDIFSGFDIGSNVMAEIENVLNNQKEMLKMYDEVFASAN